MYIHFVLRYMYMYNVHVNGPNCCYGDVGMKLAGRPFLTVRNNIFCGEQVNITPCHNVYLIVLGTTTGHYM